MSQPQDSDITVQIVHGYPLVDRAAEIYQEMLTAAGVATEASVPPPQGRNPFRTTFHVAVDGAGRAVGTMQALLGNLDELAMGDMVDPDEHLPGPICEAASIAVLAEATGRGVTELLYRSFYCFARRQEAQSVAALLDPLTLELFREDYGIGFRALGPVSNHAGLDLVPAGEGVYQLEEGLRRNRPDYYAFFTAPFTDAEKARFGI